MSGGWMKSNDCGHAKKSLPQTRDIIHSFLSSYRTCFLRRRIAFEFHYIYTKCYTISVIYFRFSQLIVCNSIMQFSAMLSLFLRPKKNWNGIKKRKTDCTVSVLEFSILVCGFPFELRIIMCFNCYLIAHLRAAM